MLIAGVQDSSLELVAVVVVELVVVEFVPEVVIESTAFCTSAAACVTSGAKSEEAASPAVYKVETLIVEHVTPESPVCACTLRATEPPAPVVTRRLPLRASLRPPLDGSDGGTDGGDDGDGSDGGSGSDGGNETPKEALI